MKGPFLLLFTLLLSLAATAQSGWISQSLDERISVKFPSTPQKFTKDITIGYKYAGKDSILYGAGITDLKMMMKRNNLDSATLAPLIGTQQYANGVRNGIAAQKPNYTFSDVALKRWRNYTIYTMSATENTNKYKVLLEIIIIGTKMYNFSYRTPAELVTKNNELFFSSIELLQ